MPHVTVPGWLATWLYVIFACEQLSPDIPSLWVWLYDHKENFLRPFNEFFFSRRYQPKGLSAPIEESIRARITHLSTFTAPGECALRTALEEYKGKPREELWRM